MKKLLAISVLLLYSLSSMGMSIHFHYCCGKLKGVDLVPVEHHCKGKKSENSNCCLDKEVRFSVEDDHEQSYISFISYPVELSPVEMELEEKTVQSELIHISGNSSPPLQYERLHLFCIYRI